MAEKWNVVSPYPYVLNNPIKYIDPDGRDIITTVKNNSNSNLYSSKTVTYTVTLTIVNLSGSDLTKTMFNQSSGSLKLNSFSGSGSYSYGDSKNGKKDIDYNINANVKYKVVTSLDQVGKNDHVMIIADKVKNSETGDALGWGNTPGQISAVEAGTIGKTGANGFNAVALHELGHNLGLDHSNGGLMNPTASGSTALSDNQRGQIVARSGIGADAKDGTYTQSKTNSDSYQKDAKTKAQEFINTNVIR